MDVPGVEFVIDHRGGRKAVLIDLKKHGALWEDLFDAYLVQRRRREPRESMDRVKRSLKRSSRRKARV